MGRAQSSLLARGQELREVHWPTPIAGLAFLSRTFVYIYIQNWSQMQHKSCSPLCGILRPFPPTYAHKWRGWSEGGNRPSRTGGSRGVSPPRRTFAARQFLLLLCSSICACKIGLNCSEMLLPANSVTQWPCGVVAAFRCSNGAVVVFVGLCDKSNDSALTQRRSFVRDGFTSPTSSDSRHVHEKATFKVARLKSAYSGNCVTDYVPLIPPASTPPLAVQSPIRHH